MRLLGIALTLALTLLFAAPSHAYKLGGQKWPTRTITYHASAPQYDAAIKAAVSAWNRSGVRIRFKRVSRASQARLKIVYRRGGARAGGDATLGYVPPGVNVRGFGTGARVRLDRFSATQRSEFWFQLYMKVLVAHELGHVLGLAHVTKPCSVMNYGRDEKCNKPPVAWQLRCRLLERDDVRGALRRYGGKARALAPEFCDQAPAPGPPVGFAGTYDAVNRGLALSWTNAPQPTINSVAYFAQPGACSTAPEAAYGTEATPNTPGSTLYYVSEPGTYCVAIWSRDLYGRFSAPVTISVVVPPPV